MPGPWTYPAELFDALVRLGVSPTTQTPPELARGAIDDLYRYELRRLRDQLRMHQVERESYLSRVIALRKKYWMLTLPLVAWEKICTGHAASPPD